MSETVAETSPKGAFPPPDQLRHWLHDGVITVNQARAALGTDFALIGRQDNQHKWREARLCSYCRHPTQHDRATRKTCGAPT